MQTLYYRNNEWKSVYGMYKRDKCGVNVIGLFGDCDRFIVESFCCNKGIIIIIIL